MISYTVFPYMTSGVAPAFHWIERPDDVSASAEALKLLATHSSTVRVTVWREDDLVFSGLSHKCATWLATAPQCRASCPAISHPDRTCGQDCGRLSGLRAPCV